MNGSIPTGSTMFPFVAQSAEQAVTDISGSNPVRPRLECRRRGWRFESSRLGTVPPQAALAEGFVNLLSGFNSRRWLPFGVTSICGMKCFW